MLQILSLQVSLIIVVSTMQGQSSSTCVLTNHWLFQETAQSHACTVDSGLLCWYV